MITVLIPAYKPLHLIDVLNGLIRQTFKDFSVVVSDDSPDSAVTSLLKSSQLAPIVSQLNLRIVQGPRCGERANLKYLLELWGGSTPLAHLHLDDDYLLPDFYRTHVYAHTLGSFCFSATPRWICNANGQITAGHGGPSQITNSNKHIVQIEHKFIVQTAVYTAVNWIGEFSNIVLTQEAGEELLSEMSYNFETYGFGPCDVSTIMRATLKKPMVWTRDFQSAFRRHAASSSFNLTRFHNWSVHLCWITYAIGAWRRGFISDQELPAIIWQIAKKKEARFASDGLYQQMLRMIWSHKNDTHSLTSSLESFWISDIRTLEERPQI